jgi:PAS domain S-box-containing protein
MTSSEFFNTRIFWAVAIGVSVILAIASTLFSLTHGIYEIFPFLYFLPIILFVYRYPQYGVLFSLLISSTYITFVYIISSFSPMLVAISTAWFVIFVTIGVVTSSFAEGMQSEERKYRGIFENSQAGIFTFDVATRKIRELNNKCARMLCYEPGELTGKDLARILPGSESCTAFIADLQTNRHIADHELQFATCDGSIRHFLISASLTSDNIVICSIIDITERRLAEKVIQKARDELEDRVMERTDELLRANEILKAEIQERKRFEAAIQLANRKLNTLSSITRHDILNQISAIVMYVSLSQEIAKEPQIQEHLKKIEQITHLIQRQIRFTRDYQNIGSNAPSWQSVDDVVHAATRDLSLGDIRVETDLDSLEIYADLLLGKVFFNLIDNTLRHGGGHVTLIRISYRKVDDSVIIMYQDNGVGIPESAKDKIFKREYYRNTGYGLFLSQEIMGITGMSIKETGSPGSGARFEIFVPKRMFRFSVDTREP